MLLSEVLHGEHTIEPEYSTIAVECSDFIVESSGIQLVKSLPVTLPAVSRVKIRHKKAESGIIESAFNGAFVPKVRQRAMFAQTNIDTISEGCELYYVFPTNGYKYLFSNDVKNSTTAYNDVCETLLNQLDETDAVNIIQDMLKISYQTTNLVEGIQTNAEILFYNIPAYYAVKSSSIDFDKLISIMNKKLQ